MIEYILNMYLQPIIVLIGLAGNLLNFLVFSRKKFEKLATKNIFRTIAVIDTFCLLQIIDKFFQYGFGFYLRKYSNLTCKVFTFLIYSFGPMSAWLLVFISIERFISISMPSARIGILFKRKSFQAKIISCIFAYNLIYYTPFLFRVENKCLLEYNLTNVTIDSKYCCDFVDLESQSILSYLDGFNSSIVPFCLMLLSSLMNTISIFKSRFRLRNAQQAQKAHKDQNKKRLKRDIQFALTSIYMNVLFIAFNLPISVIIFFSDHITSLIYVIMVDLYYSSYVINFFIYLAFNSLYRDEFLSMLRIKKS